MSTIYTDGKALADAATLARKLTGPASRKAYLTVADGRAEVVTTDGLTGVVEVVGHGTAPDGVRVAIAADLDELRNLRKVGDVTIRDAGDVWTMSATGEADGISSVLTSTLRNVEDDVPTFPTFPGDRAPLVLCSRGDDAAELADTLRSVARAASTDNYGNDVLRHVAFRPGQVAATDSYRLHLANVPVEGEGEALVPAEWVAAIPRRGVDRLDVLAEGGDGVGGAEVTFHTTTRSRVRSVTIVGRVSGSPFPNYGSLIPSEGDLAGAASVEVRPTLGDLARQVGDRRNGVVLFLGDTPDTVTLRGEDGRTATFGTATTGSVVVAANPDYLRDLADHVGDGATLRLRDGLRAMVATGNGRTSLLMPMRVEGVSS